MASSPETSHSMTYDSSLDDLQALAKLEFATFLSADVGSTEDSIIHAPKVGA